MFYLYSSLMKDQRWAIRAALSLTSSASLWLTEILKTDDSTEQALLVIFWAHVGWTKADRNQIYILKENPAPREKRSNTPHFWLFSLFSTAISWVSLACLLSATACLLCFPESFFDLQCIIDSKGKNSPSSCLLELVNVFKHFLLLPKAV